MKKIKEYLNFLVDKETLSYVVSFYFSITISVIYSFICYNLTKLTFKNFFFIFSICLYINMILFHVEIVIYVMKIYIHKTYWEKRHFKNKIFLYILILNLIFLFYFSIIFNSFTIFWIFITFLFYVILIL